MFTPKESSAEKKNWLNQNLMIFPLFLSWIVALQVGYVSIWMLKRHPACYLTCLLSGCFGAVAVAFHSNDFPLTHSITIVFLILAYVFGRTRFVYFGSFLAVVGLSIPSFVLAWLNHEVNPPFASPVFGYLIAMFSFTILISYVLKRNNTILNSMMHECSSTWRKQPLNKERLF